MQCLKELKTELQCEPTNPTPGHISVEKYNLNGYKASDVHSSAVYNSQDMEVT